MRNRFTFFSLILLMFCSSVSALPFNNKLTDTDLQNLNNGQTVIRSIDYAKNMSLLSGLNTSCDNFITMIKDFNPKYLGEVILVKPYAGNEDLPQRIETLLNNIESYTDIDYYSEHAGKWYMLYDAAEIVSTTTSGNKKTMQAHLVMKPFGDVNEQIEVVNDNGILLYTATNTNSLSYKEIKGLLGPGKMKIGIIVFRNGNDWIIYGVGGANAPHIPFLTDRIRTSLINRICSFCDYIFKKL